MNKYLSSYKRKRTEEVNELVSWYKQQRSFSNRSQPSTSSGLGSLNALNITPWDYNLDANIVIKTEKDLAIDTRDFDINIESEPQGSSVPPREYFEMLGMDSMQTGGRNAVSYASMMTDASAYEEQYLSLKIFLAACNASYKRELSSILFPIFIHFYLDLIAKPDFPTAQSFYNKFHHDHEEHEKEVTQFISKITLVSQIVLYPSVNELRSNKINLKLSHSVYLYLLQHLRHGNYTLVLQTLNRHFTVKTSNILYSNKSIAYLADSDTEEDFIEKSFSTWSDAEQLTVKNLQNSITELQKSSKILKPSICLYSFVNAYHGVTCSTFSHNDEILAAGFEDSSVRLWNLMSKHKVDFSSVEDEKSVESTNINTSKDCRVLRGHSGSVYQTEFLPDNHLLLSASQDKSVRLWNTDMRSCLVDYRGHNHAVWDVSASPLGCYFMSASLDKTLRLWNTEYAFPLRIFAGHNESVDSVVFHPNGNYIASGSSDKSCRLWDLQTGQFVRVFVGHKAPIYTLAFTKDGKYLVSAGEDANILVWDLSNGQLLNEIHGHTKTVYSLVFSSDSTMLASSGLDATVKVWESETLLKKSGNSVFKNSHDVIGSYDSNLANVTNLKFSSGNIIFAAGVAKGK